MDAALLPVKALARAKQRLAVDLERELRRAVVRGLVDDALSLCEQSRWFEWWVVSDDPWVREEARRRRLNAIHDLGGGLNRALQAAVETVSVFGAASVTIVPCDVPLATAEELRDLLDTGETSEVVVVPALRDGGTNGLHLCPPAAIQPAFGPGSMQAHVSAADARGLRCSILELDGLSVDIDRIEDVDLFLDRPQANETATGRALLRSSESPASSVAFALRRPDLL
jgi:2-phospho-L-lactate guanylyltransferase